MEHRGAARCPAVQSPASGHLFSELVRHFFGRFFDKEAFSPQGQPEAGVIQTLGLLIPPGGFISLLMMIGRPRGWQLVGLRFLLICYSMIVTGVAMVFEWEALFPDRRDYLILTPLPLRAVAILAAKFAALGIFLAIFLAAVNFFGVLLWPSVDSTGSYFQVAGVHLAVMAAAGLFSALAIAALQGVLVTLFRGAAYRSVSAAVQTYRDGWADSAIVPLAPDGNGHSPSVPDPQSVPALDSTLLVHRTIRTDATRSLASFG